MKSRRLVFESSFNKFHDQGIIGEGGAGRIYKVKDESGKFFALKLLDPQKATSDKIKRFKNEIHFCSMFQHPHIVSVVDHGLHISGNFSCLFYVMPLYSCSLRKLIDSHMSPDKILGYFDQILSGVEAAHYKKVVHRDIKPENILFDQKEDKLLIGDFGIAHVEEEDLFTAVVTKDTLRLANFQYAAPEQRIRGRSVDRRADIYALGQILNEMFTGMVPYGTNYKTIGSIHQDYAYLDQLVSDMICQSPDERPSSIEKVKTTLIGYGNIFVTRQRISKLENKVIPTSSIDDDPLILDPPRPVHFDWDGHHLTLFLSRPINQDWIRALHNMGSYSSILGKDPEMFRFDGEKATIPARDNEVQAIINHFKVWIDRANEVYKNNIKRQKREAEDRARKELEREVELQKRREKVLKSTKI
jgi:serine/threonine protein kinase